MTTATGHDDRHRDLSCLEDHRRPTLRERGWNGIDYVEVSDDQRRLDVTLIGRAPVGFGMGNVRIEGGRRIRDLRIVDVRTERHDDPYIDDRVVVVVDRPGDFSTYRLCFVESDERGRPTDTPLAGFDPRYACVDVDFKAGCPSDLDCATVEACPTVERMIPPIDYLARDWDRLRQVIFDRLSLLVPDWRERHVPDIGVTLVELLAYVGDRLSYYQDAVGTEAYLGTARKRVSVRRHVRLVDYQLHEGCNARAWVCLVVSEIVELELRNVAVAAIERTATGAPMAWDDLMSLPSGARQVYEPMLSGTFVARPAHNRIRFYTWGGEECCLLVGATRATLIDDWADGSAEPPDEDEPCEEPGDDRPDHPADRADQYGARPAGTVSHPHRSKMHDDENHGSDPTQHERLLDLRPGDVLVFEEVIGPDTGLPADADPSHRQAVCLVEVEPSIDPVTKQPIVEIAWADADALTFPLCLSTREPPPDCEPLVDVSVACGNVVLVDHGISVDDDLGDVPVESTDETCGDECRAPRATHRPGRYRPTLDEGSVTWSADVRPCPASSALLQDPRAARPHLVAHQVLFADQIEPGPGVGVEWVAVRDLLASGPDDRHFVVEIDERERATLRFGDGLNGRRPEAASHFVVRYRAGNGPGGNVGHDSIRQFVVKHGRIEGITIHVRNPLPAVGGTAPEDVARARLLAPDAFRSELARAITPGDYASIVERDFPQVQAASASFRFTGSHTDVLVAVDQAGAAESDRALLDQIAEHLDRYRRIGHDIVVRGAVQVALHLSLSVCVDPTYLRAPVQAAVRAALGARRNIDGSLGFFHPDRLSFGGSVALSDIIAAVQAIDGVDGVVVREFHRLFEPSMGEIDTGVLTLGPLEIARLDANQFVPEFGRLDIEMRGGR